MNHSPTPTTCRFLRQIHPNWIVSGELQSIAFKPTPKDEGCLSDTDGNQVTAADSYLHHTQTLGLTSAAVYGISETEAITLNLRVVSSPIAETETLPASSYHVHLDFNTALPKDWRVLSKRLRDLATARGQLHP